MGRTREARAAHREFSLNHCCELIRPNQYTQQASMTGHTSSRDSSAFAFPYKSDFVARPTSTKGQAANLSQRWAMAQPGPAGFIAARFGLSPTWTDFERLIAVSASQ